MSVFTLVVIMLVLAGVALLVLIAFDHAAENGVPAITSDEKIRQDGECLTENCSDSPQHCGTEISDSVLNQYNDNSDEDGDVAELTFNPNEPPTSSFEEYDEYVREERTSESPWYAVTVMPRTDVKAKNFGKEIPKYMRTLEYNCETTEYRFRPLTEVLEDDHE